MLSPILPLTPFTELTSVLRLSFFLDNWGKLCVRLGNFERSELIDQFLAYDQYILLQLKKHIDVIFNLTCNI